MNDNGQNLYCAPDGSRCMWLHEAIQRLNYPDWINVDGMSDEEFEALMSRLSWAKTQENTNDE